MRFGGTGWGLGCGCGCPAGRIIPWIFLWIRPPNFTQRFVIGFRSVPGGQIVGAATPNDGGGRGTATAPNTERGCLCVCLRGAKNC